jgi:hypothetical protein
VKAVISAVSHVQAAAIDIPGKLCRHLRRADDFIRLGVASVYESFDRKFDHKFNWETDVVGESSERCGLIVGTAFGPMQTNFDVLDQIVNEEQTSPTLFSHSVFNAANSYLSCIFNLWGSALTLTDFAYPFFQALQQGWLAINSGLLDRCFVLQIETYSKLLDDTCKRSDHPFASSWPAGSVSWLLERDDSNANGCVIESLNVEVEPVSGSAYIRCEEFLAHNGHDMVINDPLGSAATFTQIIKQASNSSLHDCQITAQYGTVKLVLSYRLSDK